MSNECASSSVVADEQAISLIVDGVSLSAQRFLTLPKKLAPTFLRFAS